jgi:hypothetical protein
MIKIEVTGASIAEVADKLLAIGANLRGSAIVEGARAAVNAMKAMDPVMPELGTVFVPEVAKTATAPEPLISETSAPTPGTSSSSAAEPTEQPSPISAEALRDLVLRVVKVKGRDAMVAVLDTFGAAKASDVPAAQVPELVTALEALL